MAGYTRETQKYLTRITGDNAWWNETYSPGNNVPVSGIYRCVVCEKEIASNKDDPFPPQNHHQHSGGAKISWQLIIRADTNNQWGND